MSDMPQEKQARTTEEFFVRFAELHLEFWDLESQLDDLQSRYQAQKKKIESLIPDGKSRLQGCSPVEALYILVKNKNGMKAFAVFMDVDDALNVRQLVDCNALIGPF